MAKTVKMCDMSEDIAVEIFRMLNPRKISVERNQEHLGKVIVTDVEPKDLIYPEGWYYAKGTFRNKHTSSTGVYSEVYMKKSNGDFWMDIAKYCTRD